MIRCSLNRRNLPLLCNDLAAGVAEYKSMAIELNSDPYVPLSITAKKVLRPLGTVRSAERVYFRRFS